MVTEVPVFMKSIFTLYNCLKWIKVPSPKWNYSNTETFWVTPTLRMEITSRPVRRIWWEILPSVTGNSRKYFCCLLPVTKCRSRFDYTYINYLTEGKSTGPTVGRTRYTVLCNKKYKQDIKFNVVVIYLLYITFLSLVTSFSFMLSL